MQQNEQDIIHWLAGLNAYEAGLLYACIKALETAHVQGKSIDEKYEAIMQELNQYTTRGGASNLPYVVRKVDDASQ